jgi:hypothetical protein
VWIRTGVVIALGAGSFALAALPAIMIAEDGLARVLAGLHAGIVDHAAKRVSKVVGADSVERFHSS